MTCAEAADAIPWYAAGSLAADEVRALCRHTMTCRDCRRDQAAAAALARMLRTAWPGPPARLRTLVLAAAGAPAGRWPTALTALATVLPGAAALARPRLPGLAVLAGLAI